MSGRQRQVDSQHCSLVSLTYLVSSSILRNSVTKEWLLKLAFVIHVHAHKEMYMYTQRKTCTHRGVPAHIDMYMSHRYVHAHAETYMHTQSCTCTHRHEYAHTETCIHTGTLENICAPHTHEHICSYTHWSFKNYILNNLVFTVAKNPYLINVNYSTMSRYTSN